MDTNEWTTLTIRIKAKDLETVARLAKVAKMKRGTLARNLLLAGLQDAALLDRIGLFKLMRFIEGLADGMEPEELMQFT